MPINNGTFTPPRLQWLTGLWLVTLDFVLIVVTGLVRIFAGQSTAMPLALLLVFSIILLWASLTVGAKQFGISRRQCISNFSKGDVQGFLMLIVLTLLAMAVVSSVVLAGWWMLTPLAILGILIIVVIVLLGELWDFPG